MGEITDVIDGAGSDGVPLDKLWPTAYDELKKLARSRLARASGFTVLDTTALVNESYLKLVAAGQTHLRLGHRKQFFAYASRVMRSVVIDLARERQAEMRGGDQQRITLSTGVIGSVPAAEDPLAIDEALSSLAQLEPRLAELVQLRYFGGLTEIETAEALGISERTVRRDWDKARAILRAMLDD